MDDIRFNGCRLEIQLEPQSPMIHFQSRQPGATIRATEVKPKLDCFILRRLQEDTGKDIQALRSDSEYIGIFSDKDHDALNYRMQLDTSENPGYIVAVGVTGNRERRAEYDIFYGNTAEMRRERKELRGIFSYPKLTILCFNGTLRSLIEQNITAFFLVTNFGTMQGKGFGSFVPAGISVTGQRMEEQMQKKIVAELKRETGSAHCYCMQFGEIPDGVEAKNAYCQKMFTEIKSFYSIMKSGQNFQGYARSFLYKYMHVMDGTNNSNNADDVSIDNEKAWMKQNAISPVVEKECNANRTERRDENPRYVRALLGTAGEVSYLWKAEEKGKVTYFETLDREDKKVRTSILIEDTSKDKLERVPSPIFFKIVGNVVFITAREVPDEIYDRAFCFTNKDDKHRTGTLHTPSREDFKSGKFDIQSFLASYVDYYNNGARSDVRNLSRNTQVNEIQEV